MPVTCFVGYEKGVPAFLGFKIDFFSIISNPRNVFGGLPKTCFSIFLGSNKANLPNNPGMPQTGLAYDPG
jgi:hypothetical protein